MLDRSGRVGDSGRVDSQLVARALINVVTMVLSVCVHEFAHALAAYRLGDDTSARQGRLTLNPFAHADPVGTVLLPAVAPFLGFGTFGWGKPVPYVPGNLTRKYTMRAGEAMIAFAGPFANLVMGILSSALLVGLLRFSDIPYDSPFVVLIHAMVGINFLLFFFNLLPVPPLDGSKVVAWMFGQRADRVLDTITEAGTIAVMVAIVVGGFIAVPLAGMLSGLVFAGLSFVAG